MAATEGTQLVQLRDDLKTGYVGNLTPQQQTALDELKASLQDTEWLPDVEQNPDGDRFLTRFLRASMKDKSGGRVFVVSDARERLLATLAWRRQYGADDARKAIERGDPPPEGYDRYVNEIRPRVQFVDVKSGRVIHVERFGLLGNYLDPDEYDEDQWVRFLVYDLEYKLHLMREEGKKRGYEIGTQISIYDCAGVTLSALSRSRIKLLRGINKIAGDHYCEIIGAIFVFNVSWLFHKVFSFIKGFLHPDTQAKIFVNGEIPLKEMAKLMDVEQLPSIYGGKDPTPVYGTYLSRKDYPAGAPQPAG